jgi:hypothetical protein
MSKTFRNREWVKFLLKGREEYGRVVGFTTTHYRIKVQIGEDKYKIYNVRYSKVKAL